MSEGGDRPAGTARPSELPHSIEDALASLERHIPSEPAPPQRESDLVDGVMLADTKGLVKFASPQWALMHGYEPEEIVGLYSSVFAAEDQPKIGDQSFDEELKQNGSIQGESVHARKDGTTFKAWTVTTVIRDGDEPMGIIVVARERRQPLPFRPSATPEGGEPPLGFAVVSVPDDQFLQVDAKVCELTGYSREELHQLTLFDITYSSDLGSDDEDESPSLFVAGELPMYTSERRLVRKDGQLRWVRLHKSVLLGLGGDTNIGLCVVEDLAAGGHSFVPPPSSPADSIARDVLTALPDGFALYEVIENDRGEAVDCRILDVNTAFAQVTNLQAEQVIGRTILEVLPNREASWMLEICTTVARSGRPSKFASAAHGDGRSFDFVAFTPRDGHVALFVQDVTDLRRTLRLFEGSQTELRALCHRVAAHGESERSSVASLLHDNIIKRLDALRAQLSLIKAYADKGSREPLETQLDDGRHQLSEVVQSIQALVSRLRPPGLDEGGLLPALRAYCERYSKSTSLSVVVEGREPSPRLTPEQEIALFRIAEEALGNVAAHARASKAHILVADHGERVVLTVTDDGIGIEPGRRAGSGLGLVFMRETALSSSATVRVEPAPDRGTRVVIELLRDHDATEPV